MLKTWQDFGLNPISNTYPIALKTDAGIVYGIADTKHGQTVITPVRFEQKEDLGHGDFGGVMIHDIDNPVPIALDSDVWRVLSPHEFLAVAKRALMSI